VTTRPDTPEGFSRTLQTAEEAPLRELKLGGATTLGPRINLRDLGFVYRVSDEALAEIRANERRAMLVLTTAHRYWFGG
jgi:hypothetical protein